MFSINKYAKKSGKTVTSIDIIHKEGHYKTNLIFYRQQCDVLNDDMFHQRADSPCIIIARDRLNVKKEVVKEYAIIDANNSKVLDGLFIQRIDIHANELLYEDLYRKFYIDLDLKPDPTNDDYNNITIDDMINSAITALKCVLQKEFPKCEQFHENACIFVSQYDENVPKKSVHILFPHLILKNLDETKFLAAIMKFHITNPTSTIIDAKTKGVLSKCMDHAIYTKNRLFRLPFQSKMSKSNVLVPFNCDITNPRDYLVGIYDKHVNASLPSILLLEKGHERIGDNCIFKMGRTVGKDVNINNNNTGIKTLITLDFNIVQQLASFEKIPPIKFTDHTNELEFYIACIPNHDNAQCWNVWWAIGHALKNIEADRVVDRNGTRCSYHDSYYLDLWIKWSSKATKFANSYKSDCIKTWNQMKVRVGNAPRYKFRFLASIARSYYTDLVVDNYESGININELFQISKNDEAIFDKVDVYNKDNTSNTTVGGYCKPYDFNKYKCIVSQAPMGSGKTHQIKECLKDHTKFKRVLVLSPRQTFSKEKYIEFKGICPDFMHYQNEEVKAIFNWSSIDKLILQVESLIRFPDIESIGCNLEYDLVILDEIESILYQFSSTTNRNAIKAFETFVTILQESKHIIMADAFITKRTVSLCKHIKNIKYNTFTKDELYFPIKFDNNLHNPNKNKNAIILDVGNSPRTVKKSKDKFLEEIGKDLKMRKKICIVSSSKIFIDEIMEMAKQHGINYDNVRIYTSNTDDADIDALGNVINDWSRDEIRMIIYTTKITVGINFDVKGIFHKIYIYGSIMCPNIRDLMQAHFRVRHTIDNTVMIVMNCSNMDQYIDKNDVHYKEICGHLNEVNRKIEQSKYVNVSCKLKGGFNPGVKEIYDSVASYNILEDNLGLTCYYELFCHLLKRIGYKITYPDFHENKVNEENEKQVKKDGNKKTECLFPRTYIKDFIKYREIEDIDELVSKKRNGCAGSLDKTKINCNYFYKAHLYNKIKITEAEIQSIWLQELNINNETDIPLLIEENELHNEDLTKRYLGTVLMLKRKKEMNWTYVDAYQSEFFNKCTTDLTFYRWISNMTIEVNVHMSKFKKKQEDALVHAEKEQQLRLHYIIEICKILNISNSFDINTTISNDKIDSFITYFKGNQCIEKLFHVKKSSDKFTKSRGVTILGGIFNFWNGSILKRTAQRSRIGNGQKERTFSCHLIGHPDVLWDIFTRFNEFVHASKEAEIKVVDELSKRQNPIINAFTRANIPIF